MENMKGVNETASTRNWYAYKGGVRRYDQIVASSFQAETCAVSEKQATNNILQQYKRENGFAPGAGAFSLTGKVVKMGEAKAAV